jgi:hypothetical protein
MRLTEMEYAALLARGTVRELAALPPRETVPPAPTPEPETRFLERVRRLARANGFATYHTHRSDRSEPGFVDLVLCDGHSLLLVELKSRDGKLTRDQQQWLSLLAHAGAETHVWKPHMWAEIVDRLTRKVHHADAGQP